MSNDTLEIRDTRDGGWFWADNELIDQHGETIGAYGIAVYMTLARHANNNKCWPSIGTIAKKIGASRPTVTKALNKLKAAGLVSIQRRRKANGDSDTNLYILEKIKGGRQGDLLGVGKEIDHPRQGGLHEQDLLNETNTHSKKELLSLPAGEEETNPPKKTDPPKNREPTKRDIQYQMMCTIGEVCQMDTKLNNGQISKRAKELLSAGYTAMQVERAYSGDSCWWYRHDWRGKKGQAPKPGQIHETIKAATATGKHTGPSNSGGHIPSS